MNVDLSRRAAGVKSAPCIINLSPKDKFDLARAVTAAVDFQSLSKQYQQLILQAESELSGSYKRTATFRVGTKGSAKSGNYGHAGRRGKVGGSAPKAANAAPVNLTMNMTDAQPYLKKLDPNAKVTLLMTDGTSARLSVSTVMVDNAALNAQMDAAGYKVQFDEPQLVNLPLPNRTSAPVVQAKYTNPEDLPSWKINGRTLNTSSSGAEDLYMKSILKDQGFDGKPDVVSKRDMDAYIQHGELELFRGISGEGAKYAEQFKHGELFVGRGVLGNGTYSTPSAGMAEGYANKDTGVIMRMSLRKEARIATAEDMSKARSTLMLDDQRDKLMDDYRAGKLTKEEWLPRYEALMDKRSAIQAHYLPDDPGRLAAALGYDAIRANDSILIILNRTAVRVQEENAERES